MIPAWYWWIVAVLAFSASMFYALAKAYGRDWPSKVWFVLSLAFSAWAAVLAAIGGTVVLLS